jgi:hypothetical protein
MREYIEERRKPRNKERWEGKKIKKLKERK